MWPCWELSPLGSVPCAGCSAGALRGKRPGRHGGPGGTRSHHGHLTGGARGPAVLSAQLVSGGLVHTQASGAGWPGWWCPPAAVT